MGECCSSQLSGVGASTGRGEPGNTEYEEKAGDNAEVARDKTEV